MSLNNELNPLFNTYNIDALEVLLGLLENDTGIKAIQNILNKKKLNYNPQKMTDEAVRAELKKRRRI